MAINLNKHKEALIAAWKDVLDEKTDTNWALFGYEGLTNDLKFVCKGDGGLTELIDELNSGKVQYAFLKVDIPSSSISKYILINWQGEGAPIVRKGTCANHVKHVASFFSGFHTTMHARTEDDLDEKVILDTLAKAGSAFNFKSIREDIQPSGPVGTVYKKVNPVQEINSKERDQFWMKEEQEEKKRIEAERKRREEEKRKVDENNRRRDELEAAQREKQSEDNLNSGGQTAGIEARTVIGTGSLAAARRRFDSTQHNDNYTKPPLTAPEKPVRSSVIAQRISAFTQQAQTLPVSPIKIPRTLIEKKITSPVKSPITPTEEKIISPIVKSPSSTTEQKNIPAPQPEGQKTSPLKNIDKIKMSLESPSQIQYEPIIDPSADLSPSSESEPTPFSNVQYRDVEPCMRQNIVEDETYSSGNENDDDDSDNKYSTIKRSPHSRIGEQVARQDTVIENVNYNKEQNGKTDGHEKREGVTGEVVEGGDEGEEAALYEDLPDAGLTARALYDYQAADETEITFDPGDIITHVEQIDPGWWQGLGPQGTFGLFPANYVQLLPADHTENNHYR